MRVSERILFFRKCGRHRLFHSFHLFIHPSFHSLQNPQVRSTVFLSSPTKWLTSPLPLQKACLRAVSFTHGKLDTSSTVYLSSPTKSLTSPLPLQKARLRAASFTHGKLDSSFSLFHHKLNCSSIISHEIVDFLSSTIKSSFACTCIH